MSAASNHFVIAALAAIVCGAVVPRLLAPKGRPAGTAFAYTPPAGFVPATDDKYKAVLGTIGGGQKAWVFPLSILETYTPNITETHTNKEGLADNAEIASLVRGMPEVFARSGITWSEVRHEVRDRADGTRAAVLVGDCTKGALHYRAIQMVFPDDAGTSIVTASFPLDATSRWEPQVDATIATAKGVALRVAPPAMSVHIAWGFGGGILVLLALGVASRRPKTKA